MKQSQKLNALISKVIKEELGNSQKGVVDVTIPSRFAFALADPRVSDDPSYVPFMKSKDGGKTYNLKIQSKTPEFKELKRAMDRIDNSISIDTPELEKIYNDIMSGIEQADIEGSVDLIKQGRKAGLEESDYMFIDKNDPNKAKKTAAARQAGVTVVNDDPSDPSSTKLKLETENTPEEMEQQPKASEIAGQVAEIMEKLKSMAEGEDPKKGKHAAKVMKYMESAKAALEALTAHETMLEEKEQAAKEDDATKQLKGVRKQIDKILKDKEMADRVMEKMSVQKMIDLKSKAKKDIDEAGLARIMVNKSLKEGWVKKK